MKTRLNGTFICALAFGVLMLLMVAEAFSFPQQVRLMPVLMGVITFVLFLLLLLGEFWPAIVEVAESNIEDIWGGRRSRKKMSGRGRFPKETPAWSDVLRIIGYIVAFWGLVLVLGLFLVPPVLISAYLIVEARVPTVKAIAVSYAFCGVLFTGLVLLNVDIWLGIAPELVPGFIGGGIMPEL